MAKMHEALHAVARKKECRQCIVSHVMLKGEGAVTCYGASYVSRDQKRLTISKLAADWRALMIRPQHTIRPSIARVSEELLDRRFAASRYTTLTDLYVVGVVSLRKSGGCQLMVDALQLLRDVTSSCSSSCNSSC